MSDLLDGEITSKPTRVKLTSDFPGYYFLIEYLSLNYYNLIFTPIITI